MGGLFIILLAAFISIAGSLIRPDPTPLANEMILELTTKEPGFSTLMLKVKKNKQPISTSFFRRFFFGGEENNYSLIPINSYHFEGQWLVVDKYTGSDKSGGLEKRYHVADVLFAFDGDPGLVNDNSAGTTKVTTLDAGEVTVNVDEFKKQIEEESIYTHTFLLGTDRFGRDLLSRLMSGTIVSLSVGFISVFISLVIGMLMGAIGGYFRGWVDDVVVWIINVVWSIPTLLLVIAIILALGKGFWQAFIAVGITMWVEVARVVRGQILSLREKEFIEAGRALGFTDLRIIYRHVFPNILGPVIVICAANFASAILFEAGLSFLGIGVQPPMASWGTMIRDHYGYIITGKPYLALLPGFSIMIMVLSFMLVGNGLRDAMDTKSLDDTDQIMSF